MSRPYTNEDKKAWLEANIGPVETKPRRNSIGYVTTFTDAVLHHDGSNDFKVEGHALTRKLSLSALFYLVTFANQRFDHLQVGNPATRLITINRRTLEITELPVPSKP